MDVTLFAHFTITIALWQGIDFTVFTLHLLPGVLVCIGATIIAIRFLYRDITKLSFQEPPELVGKKRLMEYLRSEIEELEVIEKGRKSDTSLLSSNRPRNYNSINSRGVVSASTTPPSAVITSSSSPGDVFLSPHCQLCARSNG